MKLLLDECIDRRLAKLIVGHDVKTVPQMGWSGLKNGRLLTHAQKEFDVFITVDRSLSFQQNLQMFSIAVVVLSAKKNRLLELGLLIPQLLSALPSLKPGHVSTIQI